MTAILLPEGVVPHTPPACHKAATTFGRLGPVRICIAGAGGNGSWMLARLVELDQGLEALGLPRLDVTMYDADTVSVANVGRQAFYRSDVGVHKSVILVHRVNVAHGLRWKAKPEHFRGQPAERCSIAGDVAPFDILITCVDSARARREIYRACMTDQAGRAPYEMSLMWDNGGPPKYWLDLGNSRFKGQIVLGQFPRTGKPDKERLPHILDLFPLEYSAQNDAADDAEPSCSLAQSMLEQDLFINQQIALRAADLLWRLLKDGQIDRQGWWVNLEEGDRPMPIKPPLVSVQMEAA